LFLVSCFLLLVSCFLFLAAMEEQLVQNHNHNHKKRMEDHKCDW
jgi:hypothetical protein